MYLPLPTTILILLLPLTTSTTPPIYYPLTRRNGSFPLPDTANLTYLTHILYDTCSRFLATERVFADNHVVRVPRRRLVNFTGTTPLQPGAFLLGEVGGEGVWGARIRLGGAGLEEEMKGDGEMGMEMEMDVDLSFLSGDFVVVRTGSEEGSGMGFKEGEYLGLRGCREVRDVLRVEGRERGVPVRFALCRPSRSWIGGLGRSGGLVGVAGGEGLRQVGVGEGGFMGELERAGVLDEKWGGVWSVVLINGREGIWSIGGTAGEIVREIEEEIGEELEKLDGHDGLKKGEKEASKGDEWEWVRVQGTDGWWQVMMKSVYVSGTRVLRNQQVILDLNTPFIIGPPSRVRALYASISGARPLPYPHTHFYSYPCFNAPEIHFEFGAFRTPVMRGARDRGALSPAGRFSLGRVERGSGFCVGRVVEGVFGESGEGERNGMEDVWVLGEPFFRDVQVAFDWKEKKVGMQRA